MILRSLLLISALSLSPMIWAQEHPGYPGINRVDENNLRQGMWIEYFDNGNVKSITHLVDGKKMGPMFTFFSDAVVKSEESFLNDAYHGVQKYYDKLGRKIQQMEYKNGELDGHYLEYHPNGNVKSDFVMERGERNGPSTWYHQNGKVSSEYYYDHGKIDGEVRYYYTNGTIKSITTFKDNEMNGSFIEYHDNGKVKTKGQYKKGKKDGEWTTFDTSGNPLNVEVFKN